MHVTTRFNNGWGRFDGLMDWWIDWLLMPSTSNQIIIVRYWSYRIEYVEEEEYTRNQYGDIIAVPAGSVPLLSMVLLDRDWTCYQYYCSILHPCTNERTDIRYQLLMLSGGGCNCYIYYHGIHIDVLYDNATISHENTVVFNSTDGRM